MAVCIPDGLLDGGRCFQCSTEQQFWMMALQLLCDIGASSGGGGIQRVFHFPSDPNGSVVAPDPAIGYGDDGSLWVKTNGVTDNTGWEPLIGAFMPELNRVADVPVQVVLATSRLDPELVFSPTLSSSFVKTPEPSAAVKKNADSFLKKMGNWFASNLWFWLVILVLAVLTDSAKGQLPPPLLRNILTTNAPAIGEGGIVIVRKPSGTVSISNTVTGGSSTLTNANDVLNRLLTNNSIKTLSITGGSISNQGTNLHFTITGGGGGGGSGDIVANLVSNEVVIVGATVLTSSAYGTMHVLSGTSNYSLVLPAVAGNAGRLIGFRVSPTYTGLVTLTNSSGIDILTNRIMWAQESAILLCNGSAYVKIAGKTIPMTCKMAANSPVTINNNTITKLPLDAVISNPTGQMADTANGVINMIRPGTYSLIGQFVYEGLIAAAVFRTDTRIHRNTIAQADTIIALNTINPATGFNYWSVPESVVAPLVVGDALILAAFQNSGNSCGIYTGDPNLNTLSVVEIPFW